MSRYSALSLAAVLLLAACSDRRDPISPRAQAPALGIWDGAHNGNADFFFLPPMAKDPSSDADFNAGQFNAKLAPVVTICRLDAASLCEADVKTFEAPVLSVSDEMYKVNWNTKESPLDLNRLYRISVTVGTKVVGYMDVDPVSNGKELRAINTNDYIGLVDGTTLPIKFRIENGVTCENNADCGEQALTNTGGIVVTNTGFAGVDFPAGWLPTVINPRTGKPYTNVTVRIERVAVGLDNKCHADLALLQFEGCYEFTTDPDVGIFAQPVVAGICSELSASHPLFQHQAFYSSGEGELTKEAPERDAPFINCEGFAGTPGPITGLGRVNAGLFAFAGRVGRMIGPKPLYAIDLGVGGELVEFSRGGWAIDAEVAVMNGDGQSGPVGGTLSLPITVKVAGHHGRGVPTLGLVATPSAGTITGPVTTNADGFVTVNWTLGAAAGPQTLTISGPLKNSVTITATGIPPVANVVLTPIRIDFGLGQTGKSVPVSTRDGSSNAVAPLAPCTWAVTSVNGTMTITPSGMLSATQADDGVVTATCDGITGSTIVEAGDFQFTATGSISDPIGDAGSSSGGSPDLTSLTVSVADRKMTFAVGYSLASLAGSVIAHAGVSVDTDRDPFTGHPGVNAGGTMDDGIISSEYLVTIEGTLARLYKYAGTLNSFTPVTTSSCSITDNTSTRTFTCTFSLSQLGYDDGYVNFKSTSSAKVTASGYSGILDVITDVGQQPGTNAPVVIQ